MVSRSAIARSSFFNGDKTSLRADLLWRPSYHLSFDLSASHNDIALPDASFSADVFGARVDYGFSTKLFASAFVQYNAATDQVVTNVRVNYLYSPLSDLFLVYTERGNTSVGETIARVLTLKLSISCHQCADMSARIDPKSYPMPMQPTKILRSSADTLYP